MNSTGDNAIFRNPNDLNENSLPMDIHLFSDESEDEYPKHHDFIEPLLPPHINYDKVNKYGDPSTNETFLFQTIYFHPSWSNFIMLGLLIAFTLWVIIMNLLTIGGLWKTHRKSHMADLYLANLAFSDLILGVLILPLMSVVIMLGYFPFEKVICDLWVFMDYYIIIASSFGSCALMCNYLWMIKWPSTYPVNIKLHIIVILCTWIAVNFSWTPSFFNDRLSTFYPSGMCGFSISRNQYFSFYIGISGFYTPLAISLLCGIWSLVELKHQSGIPLLSIRQSLSVGRRTRANTLINSIDGGFTDDSFEENNGGRRQSYIYNDERSSKRPYLKDLKKHKYNHSLNAETDPKVIGQIAKDHYPLVVSSLILFIICRSLFYVYFGVGSFVQNFFPLDLSNGVYWLMHSNAAISPLIHFAFDPELRQEVRNLLGIQRNPHRSSSVQPEESTEEEVDVVKIWKHPQIRPMQENSSIGTSNEENAIPTISIMEHFMYPNVPRLERQIRDIRSHPLKLPMEE